MIATHLDLTTAHLEQNTVQTLGRLTSSDRLDIGWPAMTVASYEYGLFITTPADDQAIHRLPQDLARVLKYAKRVGAVLVRFDADGETTHNLPTYDW